MNAFAQVSQFPAANVAAALITPSGVQTLGDVERRFKVASVTKPVVAYAVMVAVEEGAVELEDPAGPQGATLRHLLAHTSGIGFDSREPQKKVGERRIYSSAGYEWAAQVVEEATGIAFADYLDQAVCQPLGMDSTTLEGSAGHGLETTVSDLVAFAQEVQAPKLLHPDTVAQMRTVQFPGLRGIVPGYGNFKDCTWGLGFEIRGSKEHWMGQLPEHTVGHFGMSGTYLWCAPDGKHSMVMLSDQDFGDWAKPLWAETNTAIWQELSQNA